MKPRVVGRRRSGRVEAAFVFDAGGAVLGSGRFRVGIASPRLELGGGLFGSTNVPVGWRVGGRTAHRWGGGVGAPAEGSTGDTTQSS
jgi:hypothetical protein